MKILNLYAGIGGNRKLWGGADITAVEFDPQIASIYKDFFPDDEMIVGDAHKYLLEHFEEFDFIWASPPCPSHSRIRKCFDGQNPPIYPDMKLYEEIILLKYYFKGKYCVENVISYYEPLIKPQEIDNHYFWANFHIPSFPKGSREHYGGIEKLSEIKGFDINKYSGIDKIKTLRNCVNSYLALHIFNSRNGELHQELFQ